MMNKAQIARIIAEIAVLLELKGDNPFRVRAYQNGARAIEAIEEPLRDVIARDELDKIPGIGAAIAEKVVALVETGELPFYEKLKAETPPGLIEMLEIPGMGPKKIKAVHQKLGIDTIEGLAKACEENLVSTLPRFGKKTQQNILDGIRNREAYSRRHLWFDADAVATPILEGLRALPEVARAETAGSLRRGLETVGDLDFIVGSTDPDPVMNWFTSLENIQEVTAHGETKSSIRLEGGMQADLRVVPPEQFAFALHHFTGSKDHNVQMRQRALSRGYSLSEWGITITDDGKSKGVSPVPKIENEEDLFKFFGLRFIPPELREGINEIEIAEKGPLPVLLEENDIRGVFHNHTTASDGHNSLTEMAEAAAEFGWSYLGIADHSKASFQANGLDEERLEKQIEEIRALNASGKLPVHLFAGVECDILPDGSLDLDDATLKKLDYVVVSIHSSFTQPEDVMTARLIRAIEHPAATMLGHISGRLLLMREPYQLNYQKVIDAAIANNVVIEINAHPRRLDMDWRFWQRAAEKGLKTSINPDTHDTAGLGLFRAGVTTARKGWLLAENVLNTRSLEEVTEILKKKQAPKKRTTAALVFT